MVMGLMHIHQLDTLYRSNGSRNSPGVIWGHGVKSSFSPKMLFLLQITLYGHGAYAYSSARYPLKSYGSKNSAGVIWGDRGQVVIFTKKCYFSFILHGMVMWLMLVRQLDPLYKRYGSRNYQGHLGSLGSEDHFHQKCYFSFRLHGMVRVFIS